MSVYIRLAENRDVEVIVGLLMDLFEQESDFMPDIEAQRAGVLYIMHNPLCGQVYVLEKQGRVVGVSCLLFTISTALGGKVALLEDCIIDKEFRGQGLGSRLLDEVLRRAREFGCLRVTLLTDTDNHHAQGFYQKAGFVHSGMKPMRMHF